MDTGPTHDLAPWSGRAILHVDLDAFFAAVEQLDHPEWRGKPVIVGGDPDKRGVVSTCSYEARAFGVHSAMASARARVLCPDAIWTRGNFDRYRDMSRAVMAILLQESPRIQQVSIDEAFLDVTPDRVHPEHPVLVARRIRRQVAELGLTCSIGLSTNKSVSKVGSDFDKPDGLTVVWPGDEESFMAPLAIRDLSGIGPRTEERLKALGVNTLGELAALDLSIARRVLGSSAQAMIDRSAGRDVREVHAGDPAKSVSNERSFSTDLTERDDIEAAIDMICAKVGRRLRRKGFSGRTVTLKLKTTDFHVVTVRRTLKANTDDENLFGPVVHSLFEESWSPGDGLRLVGVGVSGFEERSEQLDLFSMDDEGEVETTPEAPRRSKRDLSREVDAIRDRFGDDALMFGRELRFRGRSTGTAPMNKDDD